MNIEHRTSNIEHRIMYSACRELLCRTVYLKKEGAKRFHPSTFVILYSLFQITSEPRTPEPLNPLYETSPGLIGKIIERRTSNIQRRTSNEESLRSIFFKIDRSTQKLTTGRIHYSMFDAYSPPPVGWTFDLPAMP